MNTSKNYLRLLFTCCLVVIVSAADAQYHHHQRNSYYYSYRPHTHVYVQPYRSLYAPRIYSSGYHYPYVHFGPSFGLRLSILPYGYSNIYIGRSSYYYNDGIYYRPYNNGYQVVAPPLGASVSRLPAAATAKVINGEKYYELGGTYYQEQVDAKDRISYLVVGTDGVLNTNSDNQQSEEEESTAKNNKATNKTDENRNGTIIAQLPDGTKTVVIDQQKFYQSPSGTYYKEMIDGGIITYKVVGNTGK